MTDAATESPIANSELAQVDPERIVKNPHNPRRYFNEQRLNLLRTSIQEVGVLVPLIVYRDPSESDKFVLMDGERRWRSAWDLALREVPVNIIAPPSDLDNLLRMFNIHNVREDWPLISVALSLRDVMQLSGETGEKRLSEMTGLTRSTVRRAKRLLALPEDELQLIQSEAHLDRSQQVHREDLYLEVIAAESVIRNSFPEIAEAFPQPEIIRRLVAKAERGVLRAVTDFRLVGRLITSVELGLLDYEVGLASIEQLLEDPEADPRSVYEAVGAASYAQQTVQRKAELLRASLSDLLVYDQLAKPVLLELGALALEIQALLDRYDNP